MNQVNSPPILYMNVIKKQIITIYNHYIFGNEIHICEKCRCWESSSSTYTKNVYIIRCNKPLQTCKKIHECNNIVKNSFNDITNYNHNINEQRNNRSIKRHNLDNLKK